MKYADLINEQYIKPSELTEKAAEIVMEMVRELERYDDEMKLEFKNLESVNSFMCCDVEYSLSISYQNTLTLNRITNYYEDCQPENSIDEFCDDDSDSYVLRTEEFKVEKELTSEEMGQFGIYSIIHDIDPRSCSKEADEIVMPLINNVFAKSVNKAEIIDGWHEGIFEYEGTTFAVWISNKLLVVSVRHSDNPELDDILKHITLSKEQMESFCS